MALGAPAHIVRWAQPSRQLSRAETSAFFDAPLQRLTLFSFTTRDMKVAPHAGPLSLKAVLRGEERYDFAKRCVSLRPGQVLVTNEHERYGSAIDAETKSLSLFIPRAEAEEAMGAAMNASGLAEDARTAPIDAFAQTPLAAPWIAAALSAIRTRLDRGCTGADISGALRGLLVDVFRECFAQAPPQAMLDLRRPTRDEIVARLIRVRAHIIEHEGADCAVPTLAAIACMSPYHFVRRFGELYGQTPAAFARRVRLKSARAAIARGVDAALIARQVGYRSRQAFARALRRTE